jgi:hypothetical protein
MCESQQGIPTQNWEQVYEEQSLDPRGKLAYEATRNRYAEGSLSTASGGGSYEIGINPGHPESQYVERPITRKGEDPRVQKILKALDNLDDDAADELMEAINSRDGRGVARLTRLSSGQALPAGRDRGAERTPQSVYGSVGGPSWNTASDWLDMWRGSLERTELVANRPFTYSPSEYLGELFGGGPQLTENEKREPMPTPNWDAVYEKDASMSDEQRSRSRA